MCRMMVSILALSLCGGIATLPNQGEPKSVTPQDSVKNNECVAGDSLLARNWSLRLKTVNLDSEKGVKAVSAVLHNRSRESVRVNMAVTESLLYYGLRLWNREASGGYRMRAKPSVRVHWKRDKWNTWITLHPGQDVEISLGMSSPNGVDDIYQLVYSERYDVPHVECSPASLNPGLYVVDGAVELTLHEAKKDEADGKRLGKVVVHTDNKLWVDVGEAE